jgi:hypothetical protein
MEKLIIGKLKVRFHLVKLRRSYISLLQLTTYLSYQKFRVKAIALQVCCLASLSISESTGVASFE